MSSNYVPCPSCGSSDSKRIRYVPQAGLLFSPFLNFAKCKSCGVRFEGNTGVLNPPIPKPIRIASVLIIMGFLGLMFGLVYALLQGNFDGLIKTLAK